MLMNNFFECSFFHSDNFYSRAEIVEECIYLLMIFRNVSTLFRRSLALKTACPGTATLAPAYATASIVYKFIAPSTCIFKFGYFLRSVRILDSGNDINACPAKPGTTVMINTMSTQPLYINGKSTSTGVTGLIAMPTCIFAARICAQSYGAFLTTS